MDEQNNEFKHTANNRSEIIMNEIEKSKYQYKFKDPVIEAKEIVRK